MSAPPAEHRFRRPELADRRVREVMLRHYEAVAQSTERAYLELHDLGVREPGRLLLG